MGAPAVGGGPAGEKRAAPAGRGGGGRGPPPAAPSCVCACVCEQWVFVQVCVVGGGADVRERGAQWVCLGGEVCVATPASV